MNVGDADHQHDLNDDQLDALLAAADSELLQHIQAEVDPTTTLVAVMTDAAAEAPTPPSEQTERGASGYHNHPAALIAWRVSARRLARDVGFVHDYTGTFHQDLDLHPRALGRRAYDTGSLLNLFGAYDTGRTIEQTLVSVLDSARLLTHDLTLTYDLLTHLFELAQALTRARDLISTLSDLVDWDLACRLVSAVQDALGDALTHARALTSAGGEIDASGADLSQLQIDDLDLVVGVVWTAETVWPPELRSRILTRSREIRTGVFLVGNGTERTSVFASD
ncbi:hypothetical protein [Amycolatopsis sp. NPDC051371]|uniref:hypothetical protein n=1 Tax=Amycolatopsis sp. NPDC051371 TaxID=3155800 RepID=UPI00342315E3